MSRDPDEARLLEMRALRDDARRLLRADIDYLRESLAARGFGARLKDKVSDEAHEAFDQAREVAVENKGVVAATLVALLAWLLRGPIGDAFERLRAGEEHPGEPSVESGEGEAS